MNIKKVFKKNKFNLIVVKSFVMFPNITLPLRIESPQFIEAAKKSLLEQKPIVLVTQRSNKEIVTPDDVYPVGVLCNISKIKGSDKNVFEIIVEGYSKVLVENIKITNKSVSCRASILLDVDTTKTAKDKKKFLSLKEKIVFLYKQMSIYDFEFKGIDMIDSPALLTNFIGMSGLFDISDRQKILEELNVSSRVIKTTEIVDQILEQLEGKSAKPSKKVVKAKKDGLLGKQIEDLKKGSDDTSDEESTFAKKIEKSTMPESAKKIAREELKKLNGAQPNSADYNVVKNYLEWLLSMPWTKETTEEIDISKVRASLDKDHFGLDKVKKRILEFLAVNKLRKGKLNGPIVCLVGPPGIGKTSLGQSIAKSINREFIRTSLGGVKDEAEIRGHRRTYVGAMPGKIVQNLKRVQSKNPVMLLDEIDKLTSSYQGDPSSALLEVLDPEQNSTFVDHYLDVPFDLSKILFIATANDLDSIPPALRDRMEVIYISGYTSVEKFHIAKKYLIPKVMKENGVEDNMIKFEDDALMVIINNYTKESGVRQLQRLLSTFCRESAINWVEHATKTIVDKSAVAKTLGTPHFEKEKILEKMEPGVVNGLAWTPYGGDLLFIETSVFKEGSGRIQLTGQLGNVMKESALIALSYIRANFASLDLEPSVFKNADFYIHVPSGSIKKDGPSAGIALFSSIISVLSGKQISNQIAMTGEVTLKGQVTAVGGIKEKIIAAHESGIREVLLSKQNEKDVLESVPAEIRKDIKFVYVSDLKEVFQKLFKTN